MLALMDTYDTLRLCKLGIYVSLIQQGKHSILTSLRSLTFVKYCNAYKK